IFLRPLCFFGYPILVFFLNYQLYVAEIYFKSTFIMSSYSNNNKNLDFTKNESEVKNNIDYFNLKEDRAKEEKQEKIQNFIFISAAMTFVVAFVAIIYS
ncbi:MAG: hypothetical protein VW172_05040, partial [Pelagibacteraceae bacterium]